MPKLDHILYRDSNTEYQTLLDIIYPINSVIITIGEGSPANTLGGTWVEILDGLVSCCGSGTNYPGRGNGEWQGSWTIATTQLPSHNHSLAGHTHSIPSHSHAENNWVMVLSKSSVNTTDSASVKTDGSGKICTHNYNITKLSETKRTGAWNGTTGGNSGNTAATGGGNHSTHIMYVSTYGWELLNHFFGGDLICWI